MSSTRPVATWRARIALLLCRLVRVRYCSKCLQQAFCCASDVVECATHLLVRAIEETVADERLKRYV